jgi:hypothetical protein
VVEVRHDGVVAEGAEAPDDLLGLHVVSGHVVDDDDPAAGRGVLDECRVGLDLAVLGAEGDGLGKEGIAHAPSLRLIRLAQQPGDGPVTGPWRSVVRAAKAGDNDQGR